MTCNNSVAISNMTDVWNATGNYKVAIQMDVTDTSSAANSKLLNLLVDSISQFSVDKQGCVLTACTTGWIINASQHGFGANSSTPAVYVSGSPVLNFSGNSIYPENTLVYDLGNVDNLFRNIYQTTVSAAYPTTSEYPGSGSWGIHNDTTSGVRYLTYNNAGTIETTQLGLNPLQASDEGVIISTNVSGLNFTGAGVTASLVGDTVLISIPGASGAGESFTGVTTNTTISGDGNTNPLGVPLSTDSNNLIKFGTDGKLWAESGALTSVSVDNFTITGDGSSTALAVQTGILPFTVDTNIFNTNLRLNASRTHYLDGNGLILQNTGTYASNFIVLNSGIYGMLLSAQGATFGDVATSDYRVILDYDNQLTYLRGTGLNLYTLAGNDPQVLKFFELSNVNYIGFKSSDNLVTNTIFTLPTGDGAPGNQLTTDGAGQLYWTDSGAGGGGGGTGNFANQDLTLVGNRFHDLAGNNLTIDNSVDSDPTVSILTSGTVGMIIDSSNQIFGDIFCATGGIYTQLNQVSGVIKLGALATELHQPVCGSNTQLRWFSDSSEYIGMMAPTGLSTTKVYTLPLVDGVSGYVLATDGDGTLSWSSGLSNNFANADLTLDDNRIHELNDNDLSIVNNAGSTASTISIFNSGTNGLLVQNNVAILGVNNSSDSLVNVNQTTDAITAQADIISLKGLGVDTSPALRLYDYNNSNYVSFAANTGLGTNIVYILPISGGGASQVLSTSGDGNLYWASNHNWAHNDLTLSSNRVHSLNDYNVTYNNTGTHSSSFTFINSGNFGLLASNAQFRIGNIAVPEVRFNVDYNNNLVDSYFGEFNLRNANNTPQELRFYANNNSNYVGFVAPTSILSDVMWTLPDEDGSSGLVLTTRGDGNLYWSMATGTGAEVVTNNFANADLTLNNNRNHSLDGKDLVIDNTGEITSLVSIYNSGTGHGLSLNADTITLGSIGVNSTYLTTDQSDAAAAIYTDTFSIHPRDGTFVVPELRLFDNNSSNFVGFQVPGSIATNTSYTLPTGDGGSGQVLATDGSGTLTWETDTNFANTDLVFTDDRNHNANNFQFMVTGTSIAQICTCTASPVLNYGFRAGVSQATWLGVFEGMPLIKLENTVDQIELLSSGIEVMNDTSGAVSPLMFYDGDNSNFVAMQAPTAISSDVTWTLPDSDGASGQRLSTDGAGNLSWISGITNGITIKDEGADLTTNVQSIDFVGVGVEATTVGDAVTVYVTGTGGGGGSGENTNFALNNLTLNGNRTHELAGYDILLNNSSATGCDFSVINSGAFGMTSFSDGFKMGHLFNSSTYFNFDYINNYAAFHADNLQLRPDPDVNQAQELRFYDDADDNYVGFVAPSVLTTDTMWTLPTGDGVSGHVLTTDGDSGLYWSAGGMGSSEHFANTDLTLSDTRTHVLNNFSLTVHNTGNQTGTIGLYSSGTHGLTITPGSISLGISGVQAGIEIDTTDNTVNISGIVENSWIPTNNEAELNLTGISMSQTTTLTANTGFSVVGTAATGMHRTYYLEVTQGAYSLTISTTYDPSQLFTQPIHSPYVVAFKTLSDGSVRYAGVI